MQGTCHSGHTQSYAQPTNAAPTTSQLAKDMMAAVHRKIYHSRFSPEPREGLSAKKNRKPEMPAVRVTHGPVRVAQAQYTACNRSHFQHLNASYHPCLPDSQESIS